MLVRGELSTAPSASTARIQYSTRPCGGLWSVKLSYDTAHGQALLVVVWIGSGVPPRMTS